MRSRAAAATLVIAMTMVASSVFGGSATTAGHREELPCQGSACLRAISWNVHGLPLVSAQPSERMDAIARRIAGERPDFVLLQEVWLSSYAERVAGPLHSDYVLVDAPAELTGWPRGGLVVLVRRESGWKVQRVEFHPYEDAAPWWRLDEGDGVAGKGYLVVRLARGTQRLALLDTHLQAQYAEHGHTYERTRRQQATQLHSYVSKNLGAEPVVIAGDFNTSPSDPVFGAEIAPLGEDMTLGLRDRCGCATAFGAEHGEGRWIDYLFARGLPIDGRESDAVVIRNRSADDPYSDHDGLLVRLVVGPGSP